MIMCVLCGMLCTWNVDAKYDLKELDVSFKEWHTDPFSDNGIPISTVPRKLTCLLEGGYVCLLFCRRFLMKPLS